jgi:DUF1680 family protein
MRRVLFFVGTLGLLGGATATLAQPSTLGRDYPIQPVPFTQVQVHDKFWAPKMQVNADVTIPHTLQECRRDGHLDNFLRAAGELPGDKLTQFPFDDTDIYKVIEGASYALQVKPNPRLAATVDSLIGLIGRAQEPDGYLYTFRTVHAAKPHPWIGSKRWEKEEDLSHELYNSGHLFEAAVAHYQATGKKTLLNIALKNADLLVRDFGPGKVQEYPGHQVVEIGLAKLYRITGRQQYLDLAKFFLDVRGPQGTAYNQANKRVVNQDEAEGHAVRATYMYSGMADVAALTGDASYLKAIDAIWEDVVNKKLYITGGIGATGNGEAFGKPYELPNMSAYAETCASIANVYWNNRMFLLHGDAKYIDVLERTLYNGLLAGVSLSGDHFFYPNPLASMGQHQRGAWFACACCISNMTRFMASVPGYVYAQNADDVYVNLFMASTSTLKLPSGSLRIVQTTDYPWAGQVDLAVTPSKKRQSVTLRVRVPGWAQQQPTPGTLYRFLDAAPAPITLSLNGQPVPYVLDHGYAVLKRRWQAGDHVVLSLPMATEKVVANAQVQDDKGKFTFQRGPLVYCLEGPDNANGLVQNIIVDQTAPTAVVYQDGLLNGVNTLALNGSSTRRQLNSDQLLTSQQAVKAIPYYAWANRGPSDMTVWVPYEASAARPMPAPTIASRSRATSSLKNGRTLGALADQYEPHNSQDASYPYLHWWPRKNTTEFVQYDFAEPATVSSSRVYWFDDGPWGGCRVPAAYKLYYLKDGQWLPVKNTTPYAIAKDQYNQVSFAPVRTTALKLEVQLPADNATGIHEWSVQ